MSITLATAVGLAGTLLAFACTVPQLRKLQRMGSAAGVSVAALANSTISNVAWATYGLVSHEIWVTLPAVMTTPATAAALWLAWVGGGSRARLWLPVVWLATLAGSTSLVPWVGPGPITVVLGFSIALMVAPAAVTAWRSHDVSAVAASAWLLLILDGLLAGAYGVLARLDANLLYAAVAVTGSVVILIRLALPTHVHARLVPHPAAVVGLPEQLSRDAFELAS